MKNTSVQTEVPSQTLTETTLQSLSELLYSLVPITTEELEATYGLTEENVDRTHREFRANQPGLDEHFPSIEGMPLSELAENTRAWDMARRIDSVLKSRYGWAPALAVEELRATQKKAQELLADPLVRFLVERLPAVEIAHETYKSDPDDSRGAPKIEKVVLGVLTVLMCFSAAFANEAKSRTEVAQPAIDTTPEALNATLDSLIPLTGEELVAAMDRCTFTTDDVAVRAALSFREGQPGIYRYIPYMYYTPEPEDFENGFVCTCTRRIVLALWNRFSWVPVLKTEDLDEVEFLAKVILEDSSLRAKAESLPVLRLIDMRGERGAEMENTHRLRRERMRLKMLTVWICFAKAYSSPISHVAA